LQLEHLFDGEMVYADRGTWVQAFREDEWLGWAEGTGRVSGARLSGDLRWLNHPRERPDATWLPDHHVVIRTDDGASVFVRMAGLNLWEHVGDEYKGEIVMWATFAADTERYRWLNRTLGVIEALASAPWDVEDPQTERWQLRGYTCVNELGMSR
jgi:hypothetical protein